MTTTKVRKILQNGAIILLITKVYWFIDQISLFQDMRLRNSMSNLTFSQIWNTRTYFDTDDWGQCWPFAQGIGLELIDFQFDFKWNSISSLPIFQTLFLRLRELKLLFKMNLNFLSLFSEPTVTIEANDGRIHAHQGSDVEFKCLIKGMLQKPAYVFW